MRMRASAAPVVDVTAARASAGTTCPKRRLTQGCAFLRKLNLFFFPCSLIVALRSPRRRRQVLAPLFLYLYFRVSPDRTRALPPCAQFRRPTTARADATPAALRRLINTRSRCRCARSASELPRTAHSVAAAGGSPPPRAPPPRAPPPPPMTTLARGRISCCSTPRSARCAGWGPAASRRIARRRFRRRSRRRRRRRPRRRRRRPPPAAGGGSAGSTGAARRLGGHLDRRRAPSRSLASSEARALDRRRPFEGADRVPIVSAVRRARSARRRFSRARDLISTSRRIDFGRFCGGSSEP